MATAVIITDALWDACASGDIKARNIIVEAHYPLVFRVVNKMKRRLPPHADEDELVSYGSDGLIRAATNFDRHRGTPFDSFAVAAIRGRVLDAMRAADWAPRSLRKAQRDIEATRRELSSVLQRTPTADEIGAELDEDGDYVRRIEKETERSHVRSLDEWQEVHEALATVSALDTVYLVHTPSPGLGHSTPPVPVFDTASSLDASEAQVLLAQAFSGLSMEHYFILALYYFEGITLAKAGKICGFSESRASALHEEAIEKIYRHLSTLAVV